MKHESNFSCSFFSLQSTVVRAVAGKLTHLNLFLDNCTDRRVEELKRILLRYVHLFPLKCVHKKLTSYIFMTERWTLTGPFTTTCGMLFLLLTKFLVFMDSNACIVNCLMCNSLIILTERALLHRVPQRL